ncbi:MAG TPA: aldehyde dehydrogenase family protein [Gaiellaceae bacterium]|jgi:glyceraldehyde-3-phosphate dehydrogenase (NADP+)
MIVGETPRQGTTPARDGAAARPIYVAGTWVTTAEEVAVQGVGRSGEPFATTFHAGPAECETAIASAVAAERELASLPAYERGNALRSVAAQIEERTLELGRQLAVEAGKPIKDAVVEVERGAMVFRLAAEEAERIYGDLIPLDLNAASRGRVGIVRRFPIGAIAAISPFNLPMGLAAHKVAPAIAAGCPVVLKPPSTTPLTMLSIAEMFAATSLPAGSLSVIPMTNEVGDTLVTDPRLKLLSFTGSPDVGWSMKARAGKKKVVLELGSNSAAIVDRTADVEWAAERCCAGAFKYAGQLCISVQRIYVHADVWDAFVPAFLERAQSLRVGDPLDPKTDIGPMIDTSSPERLSGWIDEALAAGGRLLLAGAVEGQFMHPTVLADVPSDATICREEAFGPVAVLTRFSDFTEAIDAVNDSRFGLQAGLFTNDLAHAWSAFEQLQVGGLMVNDGPTYRIDNMPFGGVKDSGLGREGIRYAIEDMTEPRLLVLASRP